MFSNISLLLFAIMIHTLEIKMNRWQTFCYITPEKKKIQNVATHENEPS